MNENNEDLTWLDWRMFRVGIAMRDFHGYDFLERLGMMIGSRDATESEREAAYRCLQV